MRILQLSDPHLLAANQGLVRGRLALAHFERAIQVGGALNPDLGLVTGDLCQDESWGGYARLRRALSQHVRCSVALLPGNHDHPLLLGCPSTLCSFEAVQPCPLGRADDPGGRLLDLAPDGAVQHRVLRWSRV